MATVTRENMGTLHDKVTVKLVKEDYLPSFEKTLKQYAKNANVPGFRKGMVPAGMVRKMYGQAVFGDEVVRAAGKKLEDYLKNEQLAIFAQPMVLPNESPLRLDMNATNDVDFSFEIGLKPDFEITPLKEKTSLTKYKVIVGDKMVDDEVERVKRKYGKVEDQESIADKDDFMSTEILNEETIISSDAPAVQTTHEPVFEEMTEDTNEEEESDETDEEGTDEETSDEEGTDEEITDEDEEEVSDEAESEEEEEA